MYEHNANQLIMPDQFFLPFSGQLNPNNRWVVLSGLIPWSKAEDLYVKTDSGQSLYNKIQVVQYSLIKVFLNIAFKQCPKIACVLTFGPRER